MYNCGNDLYGLWRYLYFVATESKNVNNRYYYLRTSVLTNKFPDRFLDNVANMFAVYLLKFGFF